MTHSSSADSATLGKRSEIGMPALPCFLNLKGDGMAAPVFRSVARYSIGSCLPAYFCRAGFGSNVSTCEGPPLAKMWMTRLALPGNCEGLGDSGLIGALANVGVAPPACAKMLASASVPIPMPHL